MSRLVAASNIRIETHLCDVVCDNPGCDYNGTDLNVNTNDMFFYSKFRFETETCPEASVADVASLPDPSTKDVGTIYHVVDVNDACGLYYVVDNDGHEWQALNDILIIECPSCGMKSGYPVMDSSDTDAVSLGRAKTGCA